MGLFKQLQQLGGDDAEAIRQIVGEQVVGTLAELSISLGVPHSTLKTSWRPSGMPGKPGSYSVPEIVVWRLQYEASIRPKARAAASKTVERLNQIEQRLSALEAKVN